MTMETKVSGYTRKRIKRESFASRVKKLQRDYIGDLPTQTTPPDLFNSKPWEEAGLEDISICTEIPLLGQNDLQADLVKSNIARSHCEDLYPQEAWVHAYTDGSATKAVRDGGAGVFIRYPNGETLTRSAPTGTYCSNYKAEVQALTLAAEMVKESEYQQVVFLTVTLCP